MRLLISISILLFSQFGFAALTTQRNYAQSVQFLQQIAAKNPTTAKMFVLGYSNTGVAIEGIQVGTGSIHHLVVAAHHGNEYGSTELALHFAESLAANPIADQTIHIIPVLNLDGYNNRTRWERINGRSIDLNRDYPGPCGSEGPFHSRASKALADYIDQKNIVASATLHTYWPAVLYPWGISTHDIETTHHDQFVSLAQAAAQFSRYQVGNSTEVIYPADGCFEDYAYWKHGIWSLLFEVGHSHSPSVNAMQEMLNGNVPGLRNMFEKAPKTRATNHAFTGRCDTRLKALDLHIE